MTAIRWSDNDKYFGPITYSRDKGYRPFAIQLDSGPPCRLRLSGFGHTLLIPMPPIISAWKQWVDTSKYDWAKGPNDGYWDVHRREYGFSWVEGAIHLHYGAQTMDSSTTKSKIFWVPWQQKRFIRHSLFDLNGELFVHYPQAISYAKWRNRFNAERALKGGCPKMGFTFKDYDGGQLTATTLIEEREWRHGTGLFQWLSFFIPKTVNRSLDIEYSGEVGKRKGSWKGGTIGTGISMLPGELHEAAFRRHCEKEGLTFIAVEA